MKLQRTLLLILLPTIAAPLIALGYIAFAHLRDTAWEQSLQETKTLVEQAEQQLKARMETARADALDFSNSTLLDRYLLVEDKNERHQLLLPDLQKLLASYQAEHPEYYEIRVVLPDGIEDVRSTVSKLPNVTIDEATNPYFRRTMLAANDGVTQIMLSPDTGTPTLLVSRRITSIDRDANPLIAKPKIKGYLLLSVDLGFLFDLSTPTGSASVSELYYIDGQGHFLFGTPTDAQLLATAEHFKQLDHGNHNHSESHRRGGQNHHFVSRQLHGNLIVFGLVSEEQVFAQAAPLWQSVGVLFLISLIATAALLYLLLRRLLINPLMRLREAAIEIGNGNLITELGIERDDEIGDLIKSFETMSQNLLASRQRAEHLAYHDSLTDLPNRRRFKDLLEQSIPDARRRKEQVGVLFVDLDGFKKVNDVMGHNVGDNVLKQVAERLSAGVRDSDSVARGSVGDRCAASVARVGGDEFIVLLPGLASPIAAARVSERLLEALDQPIAVNGQTVEITASIGIAVYPQDGEDPGELIQRADIAMYDAKARGKNCYGFFIEEMNTTLNEQAVLVAALRQAISKNEFCLHYQPQVDTSTGELASVEALIRWNNPELGLVSPATFIPVAEESELIVEIGAWVLSEACQAASRWARPGAPGPKISVNISPRQFLHGDIQSTVEEALAASGLPASQLDLEITEASIMDDPDKAAQILDQLKTTGVTISMDGFGTGYSPLSALKRFPIDCIKVDQSFVRNLHVDEDNAAITSAIVAMGKRLDMQIVAEGVECSEQADFLKAIGCDRLQGYLYSRPVPIAEFERDCLRTRGANFSAIRRIA